IRVHVEQSELADRLPRERPLASQQLHVHDGQAVLVGVLGDPGGERLGGGVLGRNAGQDAAGARAFEVLGQAEVRHLDVVPDQEQVAGFDVHVHQVVGLAQVVEPVGRVGHVLEQPVAGDAGKAGRPNFLKDVVERLLRQLHDNGHLAVHDVDPLDRQDERVAHLLDPLQGVELLAGPAVPGRIGVQVAEHELDGLEDLARGLAQPHFAEPAGPERLDEAVPGDGFLVGVADHAHGAVRADGQRTAPEGRGGGGGIRLERNSRGAGSPNSPAEERRRKKMRPGRNRAARRLPGACQNGPIPPPRPMPSSASTGPVIVMVTVDPLWETLSDSNILFMSCIFLSWAPLPSAAPMSMKPFTMFIIDSMPVAAFFAASASAYVSSTFMETSPAPCSLADMTVDFGGGGAAKPGGPPPLSIPPKMFAAEPTLAAHRSPSARFTAFFSSSEIANLLASFCNRPVIVLSNLVITTILSDAKWSPPLSRVL